MVHRHLFISEELLQWRQELFVASFDGPSAQPALHEMWPALDEVFKNNIVNASPADWIPRLSTESVLNYHNPNSSHLTNIACTSGVVP